MNMGFVNREIHHANNLIAHMKQKRHSPIELCDGNMKTLWLQSA